MDLFIDQKDVRLAKLQLVAQYAGVSLKVKIIDAKNPVVTSTPTGTLPILRTPRGAVARTNVIIKYLAGLREDAELAGAAGSIFEQSAVDQWLEFGTFSLEPLVAILTGTAADVTDKAEAASFAASALHPALATLDKHLATRTFLAAERITVADLALVAVLSPVWGKHVEPLVPGSGAAAGLSHLSRWYTTVRNQASVVAVLGEAKPAGAAAGAASGAAAVAASGGAGTASASGARAAVELPSGPTAIVPTALTAITTRLPSEKFGRYRTRIGDLLAAGAGAIGSTVTVTGWARSVREQGAGALSFIALNDGSTFDSLQVVAEKTKTTGFDAIAASGGKDAAFRVVGSVVKSPAKGQEIELVATSVEVLGGVADPATYPLAKGKHTVEHLREIPHLRPRSNLIGAVARIRNACAYATHTFFQERGFLYVHTPIVTGSDCEGAGEMFQVTTILPDNPVHDVPRSKPAAPATAAVAAAPADGAAASGAAATGGKGPIDYSKDFFGKPSFLTVSGQLQVETFSVAMSDVYTFGPTFRAERSFTTRHLAEFWMIEPEIAFATLADDMALAEDYLKYCTRYVLDHCGRDLAFFEEVVEKGLRARLNNVVSEPFQVLTYTEAIELLQKPEHAKKGAFKVKPEWGIDLGSEHERYITEQVYKKPVILTNYPKDIKAFYMKLNPDGKTVAAMDVLVPKVGEIIGGSQREDDFEKLHARMAEMGVGVEGLKWYLDLRKYGSVPHAGFGLGFERLVMYVTGLENIRDAIPFPRWPGNCAL